MWVFNERHGFGVETDPTQGEFFVSSESDRSGALMRETVQNSLDARREDAPQVLVRFALHGGELLLGADRLRPYAEGLVPHLRACGLDTDAADMNHPRFLVVEDFGTHGLRGDPESRNPSDFYHFWHVVGRSGKSDVKAGRWGLGKTVFPCSSLLSAFFGYTIRSDDRRHLLFGQACLKTHEFEGRTYLPYAFYQASGPRTFELPLGDPDCLVAFRECFKLTRCDESGLSVVVPFPHQEITEPDLVQAAIRHYFFPILARQLVIQVNDQVVDASTIVPLAERVLRPRFPDMAKAMGFAVQIRDLPPAAVQTVDSPGRMQAGGLRFSPDAFSPEHLNRMREEFHTGCLLAIRIPVAVEPKGAAPQPSHVTVYLKHDPMLFRGHDFYLRSGISLSGQSVFGSRPVLGMLLADDDAMCRFLGDAENPAHAQWNLRSSRLTARYHRASETVRFVREVMVGLVDALMQAAAEEDRHALSDVFYTSCRDGRSERDRTTEPRPGPEPTAFVGEPRFLIQSVSGGFRLKPGSGLMADHLPCRISVRVAYEIRHGDPFKKYACHDFRLEHPPVIVRSDGVDDLRCRANRLDVTVAQLPFVLDVSGFDRHRDLKVRVDEGEEEST